MKGRFSRLEAHVESLVEGTFARLLAGRVHPRDLLLQLARALEDSAGSPAGPATLFIVRLHPADAQALLQAQPDLAQTLAAELVGMAREIGMTLRETPEVRLLGDPGRKPHSLLVLADSARPSPSHTQGLPAVRPASAPPAPRAYLIVNGERTVMLEQPVLTLGRRLDCDLVVDDLRVSRAHAQLRLRFSRYVLYDLGSTDGTFVNGQRVDEVVLQPGDVISLGGVPLIYGEEASPPEPPSPPRGDDGETRSGTRPLDVPPVARPGPASGAAR